MAMPGQPPVQGGLGAMAPKPQGAPPPPGENKDASRISAMEQESPMSADDVARKSLMDRQQQSLALEQQIQLLTKSLDSRLNPGFDTPLMAMAAGFLKPTKTGSFGESLGYGMENYSKESENEFARKQLADKQRLEYMQKLADLQAQRGITDWRLQQMAPDQTVLRTGAEAMPAGAPGAAPTVAPNAAPSAPAAGGAAPATGPTAPTIQGYKGKPITMDMLDQAWAIDPTGKLGKEYEEKYKLQQEQIKIQRGQLISTPDGMFNVDTQKYMPLDPYLDKPLEAPIPYVGTQKITQRIAKEIDDLDKKFPPGSPARVDEFAKYYARRGIGDTTYEPAVAGKPAVIGGMKTPGQQALEKEGASETQKLDIQDNAKAKQSIYDAGRSAYPQILAADQLYRLSTDPKTRNAFGVLQQNNIQSAIMGAISDGLKTQNGSIQFAGIEDAVRKLTGTQEEVNAALQAARYYAELELNYARTYLKGQGAVSDNERKIVGKIGGSLSDSAQVAAAKAETVKARANYDKQVSDLYYQWEKKNPGKMVKDFERDPRYIELQGHFDEHMGKLADKYFPGTKEPKPPAAAPASPSAPPAANKTEAKPQSPATAPSAPPIVSGDDDPAYKNLKPGQQYIYNGQVKTKK